MGTSLVVQWLVQHTTTAGGMGSIPGLGTKILHATCVGKKKKVNCILFAEFEEDVEGRKSK